jgi:hypothetical protein
MNYFNDYFKDVKYKDDFGWSEEWNQETNKWLVLANTLDHEYYLKSKSRVTRSRERWFSSRNQIHVLYD